MFELPLRCFYKGFKGHKTSKNNKGYKSMSENVHYLKVYMFVEKQQYK